jgi:hypothetical protein
MSPRSVRRRRVAVAAATAVLALALPIASARAQAVAGWPGGLNNVQPGSGIGWAGCSGINKPSQVGAPGDTGNGVCGGITISFIGPAVGQIATAIGPTIISAAPVILAPITVSNGSVQQGSTP